MTEDLSGVVVYSTKEILDSINEKLAKAGVLADQHDKRLTTLETRVMSHDRILTEQLPKFQRVVEDLDVQRQVEAALDSRRVSGISNRDRAIAGALSACILALGIVEVLPKVIGGG